MKIFIEHKMDESGKGKFFQRMTKVWDKQGVAWSQDPSGCDVRLAVTRFRTKFKGPTVLRIDGAHMNFNFDVTKYKLKKKEIIKKLEWKNNNTAKNIQKSSAVIWQSDFCRRAGRKVFKVKPKKEYVIFNGADPADYLRTETSEKIVLMSASWVDRPHKRLKEMLDIAYEYVSNNKDVVFYVAGRSSIEESKHNRVKLLGHITESELRDLLSRTSCMLNLAWYDWCPNAVVESLIAGVPVICSDGTGVAEIVKDSGIILKLDEPVTVRVKRAGEPPAFNPESVHIALDKILSGVKYPFPEHLHINKISNQYLEVLKSVIK